MDDGASATPIRVTSKTRARSAPSVPRLRQTQYGTEWRARGEVIASAPVSAWTWTPHDPRAATLRPRDTPAPLPYAVLTNYRPARRRQRVVLVFDMGVESAAFITALRGAGLPYFFLDYREFMRRGTIALGVGAAGAGTLRLDHAELRLRDVAAVVWHPPLPVVTQLALRPVSRHLHLHRWMQALRDLAGLLPRDTIWMPAPPIGGSNDWQEKLAELALAAELGLAVPESLSTNDLAAAAAFIRRHGGRVLFRDFSRTRIRFRTVFADRRPSRLRTLVASPCVFQQYIDKAFDVRAVVIGRRVFACRIDSQASPAARVDWRVYDNARVRWDRMRLPRRVDRALVALTTRLGLTWASCDLVKAREGGFHFLEVNRPGLTYWLQPFVGLDVPHEVVRFVAARLRVRGAARGNRLTDKRVRTTTPATEASMATKKSTAKVKDLSSKKKAGSVKGGRINRA